VFQSQQRTHTELNVVPEVLNINLGNDCNLTCSYCCKQYSTAWLRDISNNGEYFHDDRFIINAEDQVINKLGQLAIKQSRPYQTILNEVAKYKDCKQVVISGGEPFLYNGLETLVSSFDAPVEIFTGLGVDTKRFTRILDSMPEHVKFTVSAENMGKLYEFNRHGNTWDNFQRNLDVLANRSYRFCSVISNTTIHGYAEFERTYGTLDDQINICNDPDYLGPNVLDDASKNITVVNTEVMQAVAASSTVEQQTKARQYITEFARRRNLSFDIFPDSFQEWINE
jgi:organic radical activating enzyme